MHRTHEKVSRRFELDHVEVMTNGIHFCLKSSSQRALLIHAAIHVHSIWIVVYTPNVLYGTKSTKRPQFK